MDPQFDPDYFDKFIPATISLIVTGIASVIIGIYFEKFRNKLIVLKYKIFFQPLATTSQNDYWGDIEVYHNKRVVSHLSFVTVEIQNDCNRDMENLNVDIWVDNQSQFLGVSGFYNESKNAILLEQDYYNYYTDVLQRNLIDLDERSKNKHHITSRQLTNEIQFVLSHKKFHLPVFNRHSSITIHLLIENFKGLNKPVVTVSVLHKSTKLILETDKETERKRTTIWMICIGLIIFIAGFSLLLKYYSASTTPLILCGVLGVTYSLIGLGIYHFGRYVKRFLS